VVKRSRGERRVETGVRGGTENRRDRRKEDRWDNGGGLRKGSEKGGRRGKGQRKWGEAGVGRRFG